MVAVSRSKYKLQEFWSLLLIGGWGSFPVAALSPTPNADTRRRSHPCSSASGALGLPASPAKLRCLPDLRELRSVKRRSKAAPRFAPRPGAERRPTWKRDRWTQGDGWAGVGPLHSNRRTEGGAGGGGVQSMG